MGQTWRVLVQLRECDRPFKLRGISDGSGERNELFHSLGNKLDFSDTFFLSYHESVQSNKGVIGDIEIGVVIHGRIGRAAYDLLIHLYLPLVSFILENKQEQERERSKRSRGYTFVSFLHTKCLCSVWIPFPYYRLPQCPS